MAEPGSPDFTREQRGAPHNSQDVYLLERLAAKTLYAADLLESSVELAQTLDKLQVKVSRYLRQARLLVTWRRGQGVATMVGAAAKSVGGVLVLAAPLHPKLSLAVRTGHRLWRLGAGLKILTAVGGILRDMWQSGCRQVLVDFTRCAALLTTKVNVLQECVLDLQKVTGEINSSSAASATRYEAPHELIHVLRDLIPPSHITFATHVINIVFGDKHYSPMFDLALLATDVSNHSGISQVIREIEGFHFTEFAESSDAKCLVAIGGFLHISRELLDFLDGFQRLTDRDCRFLRECLEKFTEESLGIVRVVSLLTGLNNLNKSGRLFPQTGSGEQHGAVQLPTNLSPSRESSPKDSATCSNREINISANNSALGSSQPLPLLDTGGNSESMEESQTCEAVLAHPRKRDILLQMIRNAEVVQNSKDLITKGFSTMVTAVEKGSSLISSSAKRRQREDFDDLSESQFVEGGEHRTHI